MTPYRHYLRAGGIAQTGPHDVFLHYPVAFSRSGHRLASLDDDSGRRFISGYKILIYHPLVVVLKHIPALKIVIETAREGLRQQFGCDVAFADMRLKKMPCIRLPHISVSLAFAAGVTVIGADQHAFLGLSKVISDIAVIVGLEKGAVALRIDCSEISLHAHRPRQTVEQTREVIHGAAAFKSNSHDDALFVHQFLRHLIILYIIGGGVHHSESRLVHPDPGLLQIPVRGIEKRYIAKISILTLHIFYLIIGVGGVSVFP